MKVKNILISQPEPEDIEKSPYKNLIANYEVNLKFYKLFDVVGISVTEFRQSRIHIKDYTAIIFNSKISVDHFFRMAKELRESIPETMKYFCTTEAIALYLQNYIQYRKRKVFYGAQNFADLIEVIQKHKEEKYLFACSDEKQSEATKLMDKAKIKYTKAPMYRTVAKEMKKDINIEDYDMVVLFSPIGVRALLQNYPDIKDTNIQVAALGPTTQAALTAAGLKLAICAPTKTSPSMAMAIENFLSGKTETVAPKAAPVRKATHTKSASSSTTTKKTKSVISNKAKYKQLMEEKKAKAAAKRAERAAAKESKAALEKDK